MKWLPRIFILWLTLVSALANAAEPFQNGEKYEGSDGRFVRFFPDGTLQYNEGRSESIANGYVGKECQISRDGKVIFEGKFLLYHENGKCCYDILSRGNILVLESADQDEVMKFTARRTGKQLETCMTMTLRKK